MTHPRRGHTPSTLSSGALLEGCWNSVPDELRSLSVRRVCRQTAEDLSVGAPSPPSWGGSSPN